MITYKSRREVEKMRTAGKVVAEIFELVGEIVRPGITTGEIDARVEGLIREGGNRPSFKGYRGFPASICASVNEQIVHGMPGDRVLREGDLLTVDVGVIHKGYHADAARSYAVAHLPVEVARLAAMTAKALDLAIAKCRPGNRLSDIARAVESLGRKHGYGVVEQYVGHGIGTQLHEDPQVPNYVTQQLLRNDLVLRPGLVVAIEPMFNLGTASTRTLADGWTVVTADGKCSAHYEDTVAITEEGMEILTRPEGSDVTQWLGTPRPIGSET